MSDEARTGPSPPAGPPPPHAKRHQTPRPPQPNPDSGAHTSAPGGGLFGRASSLFSKASKFVSTQTSALVSELGLADDALDHDSGESKQRNRPKTQPQPPRPEEADQNSSPQKQATTIPPAGASALWNRASAYLEKRARGSSSSERETPFVAPEFFHVFYDIPAAARGGWTAPREDDLESVSPVLVALAAEDVARARRCCWLMKRLVDTMNGPGAYLTPRLFVSKAVWLQAGTRVVGFSSKVLVSHQVVSLLKSLSSSLEFYGVSTTSNFTMLKTEQIDHVVECLNKALRDAKVLQDELAFNVSYVCEWASSQQSPMASPDVSGSSPAPVVSSLAPPYRTIHSQSAPVSPLPPSLLKDSPNRSPRPTADDSFVVVSSDQKVSERPLSAGMQGYTDPTDDFLLTETVKDVAQSASNRFSQLTHKVKSFGYSVAKEATRMTKSALPHTLKGDEAQVYMQCLLAIFSSAEFLENLLETYCKAAAPDGGESVSTREGLLPIVLRLARLLRFLEETVVAFALRDLMAHLREHVYSTVGAATDVSI